MNNDMSWVVEASRKAKERREQAAAPFLTARVPTGLTGLQQATPEVRIPVGAQSPVQRADTIIEQMRQAQAARPVVPTKSGMQLFEDIRRQKEAERAEQERWENTLERQRVEDERYATDLARQLERQRIEDERWQMAWDRDEQRYRDSLRRGGSAGSGAAAISSEVGIDPKIWAEATEIAREIWNNNKDYVWVNNETGEMIKEENGMRPLQISEYDPKWERQSIARTPFDSLDEYEKARMIYEIYYSGTHLPTALGIDPRVPPSALPKQGTEDYYRTIANEARSMGYNEQDIAKMLIENYGMEPSMAVKIGLSLPQTGIRIIDSLLEQQRRDASPGRPLPSLTPNIDKVFGRGPLRG